MFQVFVLVYGLYMYVYQVSIVCFLIWFCRVHRTMPFWVDIQWWWAISSSVGACCVVSLNFACNFLFQEISCPLIMLGHHYSLCVYVFWHVRAFFIPARACIFRYVFTHSLGILMNFNDVLPLNFVSFIRITYMCYLCIHVFEIYQSSFSQIEIQ